MVLQPADDRQCHGQRTTTEQEKKPAPPLVDQKHCGDGASTADERACARIQQRSRDGEPRGYLTKHLFTLERGRNLGITRLDSRVERITRTMEVRERGKALHLKAIFDEPSRCLWKKDRPGEEQAARTACTV